MKCIFAKLPAACEWTRRDAARDATDPKIRPKSRLHRTYAITFNQTVCCLQAAVGRCGQWTHDLTAFDPGLLYPSIRLSFSLLLLTHRTFVRLWLIASANNSWRSCVMSKDSLYLRWRGAEKLRLKSCFVRQVDGTHYKLKTALRVSQEIWIKGKQSNWDHQLAKDLLLLDVNSQLDRESCLKLNYQNTFLKKNKITRHIAN